MSTPGVSQPTYPGSASRGFAWKSVIIQGIQGNTAVVIDQLTKTFNVSMTNLPAKGIPPAVGEQWIVTRQYGVWAFALCLNAPTALQESDIQNLTTDLATLTTATSRTGLLNTLMDNAGVHYTVLSGTVVSIISPSYVTMVDTMGNVAGTAFTAPRSGIVRASWGGNFRTNGTGGLTNVALDIRTGSTVGSGSDYSPAVDYESLNFNAVGQIIPGSRTRYAVGLTPGQLYNAFIVWKGSTGSVDCNSPWVDVVPQLE